jgi:hypothetical protein
MANRIDIAGGEPIRATRRDALAFGWSGLLALTGTGRGAAAGEPAMGVHDFRFETGSWKVRHRKLTRRLAGDDTWYAFDGLCTARELLGGAANLDDHVLDGPEGRYRAASLRRCDPATGRWSIWWWDSRSQEIGPPGHGGRSGDALVFRGDDDFEGRPILVRTRYFDITPTSALWEQAFSDDHGRSWETNWTMQFERAS